MNIKSRSIIISRPIFYSEFTDFKVSTVNRALGFFSSDRYNISLNQRSKRIDRA